jgi:hypothetical protein
MKRGGAVLSMRLVRRVYRAYIMDGTCFTVNKTQTSRLKWSFCLWENAMFLVDIKGLSGCSGI